MKNVTGYDLSKLMCGSFGTLAVLTEIILKVLPAPETERTVVATGLEEPEGIDLLIKAAGSPYDVSGLVHLPPGLKTPTELEGLAGNDKSLTLIRLEGPPPSVGYRCDKISGMTNTQAIYLENEDSASLWKGLREIVPLQVAPEERLWRISLPPSTCIGLVNGLRLASKPRIFYDWGGGLVWCVLPEIYPAKGLHRAAKDAGGHARIFRSGDGPTGEPYAFPPLDSVKMKLHQNLKEAFDPERVLNPGRMYADL